jgi:hypothetical protein
MCMQCMATAMTAGAGVSGTRAYIAAKHFSWMTPRRMRAVTATLLAAGLVASTTLVSGSTAQSHGVAPATQQTQPQTKRAEPTQSWLSRAPGGAKK